MLIGRDADLDWLNRQTRLSSLILIAGVRGIGKTRLVRDWIAESKKTFSWITLERFKDLPEALKIEAPSVESALERIGERWRNLDVVVWDEIHLLSPMVRQSLFSFLRSSPFLPLQVFITDEELPELTSSEFDFSRRTLAPLDLEQVGQYLAQAGVERERSDPMKALSATGGLPLFLHLWVQGGDTRETFRSRIFEKLPPEERQLLRLAATLGRAFDSSFLKELDATGPGIESALSGLRRKLLVDPVPGVSATSDAGGLFVVPAPVRILCLQSLSPEERSEASRRVYCALRDCGSGSFLGLELLIHAIRSGKPEYLEETLKTGVVRQLEQLRSLDLQEFQEALLGVRPESLSENARCVLSRLKMNALYYLGDREGAVALGTEIVDGLSFFGAFTEPEQELVLDQIQFLNRLRNSERVRATVLKSLPYANELYRNLFQIELAVSIVTTEPANARELLKKLIVDLQRAQVSVSGAERRDLALAQAHFQLARAHDLLSEAELAEREYHLALKLFKSEDRPYFSAVTLLNLAWLALKKQDWSVLDLLRRELFPIAERFGYNYVLAGIEIVEATQSRLSLEWGRALRNAQSCRKRLSQAAPSLARLDADCEWIRILQGLGLRSQAREVFDSLSDSRNSGQKESRARLHALELEIIAPRLGGEEFLDRLENIPAAQLELEHLIIAAQRGLALDETQRQRMRGCLGGQVALAELELVAALQAGDPVLVWQKVGRLERLIEKLTDPMPERAALFLLQSMLVEKDQRQALLERAALELRRWGCDEELKFTFQAWYDNLSGKTTGAPEQDPRWRKAAPGDRERWFRWWGAVLKNRSREFIIFSQGGRTESESVPPLDGRLRLRVLEHLAEVSWNGKLQREFIRRHALRRLLSLLLEHSPNALDKETISSLIWGEAYSPSVHDPRIYTSIQRLRTIFRNQECIQNWGNGYRWNPAFSFQLIRLVQSTESDGNRCQSLILQSLETFAKTGRMWIPRSEFVSITQFSEATVKRELAKLLEQSRIRRSGNGRAVVYALPESRS